MQAFAKLIGQTPPAEVAAAVGGAGGGNARAIPLPRGKSAAYSPEEGGGLGPPPQPRVEPIAHLPTPAPPDDADDAGGSLLDVTPSYIVYSVKNGLVRVLDRSDGSKTLLRGHTQKVGALAFFPGGGGGGDRGGGGGGADVLATVGGEGDAAGVLIWRLYRTAAGALEGERLLEVRYRPAARLVWHPFDPNKFVLVHGAGSEAQAAPGRRTAAAVVETTRLVTVPHAEAGHAVCLCGGGGAGAATAAAASGGGSDLGKGSVQLVVPREGGAGTAAASVAARDLAFSPSSARHVAVAHADGRVRLFDLGSRAFVDPTTGDVLPSDFTTPEEAAERGAVVSATVASSVTVGDGSEPVDSVRFLPGYADARADGGGAAPDADGANPPYLTPPFLTGRGGNATVTLWSPFSATGSPPVAVRSFRLGGAAGPLGGPLRMAVGDGGTFAYLASTAAGSLYALRVSSRQGGGEGATIATGFDCVLPFDSVHPVYSLMPSTPSGGVGADNAVANLYCVQSKAIQILTFTSKMLAGPADANAGGGDLAPGVSLLDEGAAPIHAVTDDDDADDDDDDGAGVADDHFEDYEDDGGTDDSAVAPASAPSLPPGMAGPQAAPAADPFANWLGSLALGAAAGPPPPPAAKPAPDTVRRSPPAVAASAIPPAPTTPVTIPGTFPKQALLSPMALLKEKPVAVGGPDEDEEEKVVDVNKQEEKVAPAKRRGKQSRSSSKSNGKGEAVQPTAPAGKIEILKRSEPAPDALAAAAAAAIPPPPMSAGDWLDVAGLADSVAGAVVKSLEKSLADPIKKTVDKLVAADRRREKEGSAALNERDKERAEKMAAMLVDRVSAPVVGAFHSAMKDVMIPAYEAATRQMFAQVATAIESQQQQQQQTSAGPDEATLRLLQTMASKMGDMAMSVECLTAEVTALRNQVTAGGAGGASLPPGMASPLGGGVPPGPPAVDPVQMLVREISSLLERREYEQAFTRALSASDSDVAIYTCREADIAAVLQGPGGPALSQPILLCLMQQLGAVLAATSGPTLQTVLVWLQDIAVTLNPADPSIVRHAGKVLSQLVENVNGKMAQGDPSLRRPLQMLLQVIRGMGGV